MSFSISVHSRKNIVAGKEGFTLIELLVVIAIIAVLAVAAILTLNPVQLIRQSRDATRVADLATTKKALALYQFTNGSLGAANTVYVSIPDSSSSCANLGLPALPAGWTYACAPSSSYRKPDGTGWIPIDLTILSTGSPIGALPIDPINTTSTNFYYTYIASSSIYKFTASLESQKQMNMMAKDGGIDPALFETGTPSIPSPRGGLVGYWRFDEGGGTTAGDSSGGGNTGTLTNGPTWTGGQVGSTAISFDGVDDYVNIADNNLLDFGTGDFTVGFWVKIPINASLWPGIVTKGGSASAVAHTWGFLLTSTFTNQVRFEQASDAGGTFDVNIDSGVLSNGWHHILARRSGATTQLYVDGLFKVEDTSAGSDLNNTSPIRMGSNGSPSASTVDDVRIYNRALSAAEIQALYNATK